ncbi:polyamine ABC transporter substrate-binding protein [Methylobacterium indicum]|uniref:ABC transporter substrate-binding protein n=2 Tax=Methylobacterium indicum TaxID=1775910 RepID=UPI000733DECD|nr:ABC transporter substrate-binding protein [Methylobacterium indicum]KTS20773.1 polyamine ABC transporter substrate-binding protein [Methylobacterium indicum]KTS24855.1 polyamine ABC transporter substrate-binding protein [Methylobacterium indicum]KTS43960.1 polyamine ABC transporter substrate-binding protein [Methylobacterium indicum]
MMRRFLFAAATLALLGPAPALAQAPTGKTLTIGMAAADISQLDPFRATSTQDKPVVSWIFNGLVRFKPGSTSLETLEPDLAESWTRSDDGRTWTFALRKGVKFHGGYGELTADDVVYSLKRAADPKTSSFATDYAAFDAVEAVDPYTVKITLKHPVPSLLGLVANYHGGNVLSRKAVEALGNDFRLKPIGTGPFAFAEYKPNESVRLTANPDYFRGTPKLAGILYRLIPADAARDLAFTSGELDVVYGRQDQRWAERFGREADVSVDIVRPAELALLHLNTTHKPLDDVRVRRAVAAAISQAQIVQFKGASVTEPAVSIIPKGYLGTDDKAPLPPYDPTKAKALLAEAGHPNGITITAVQTSLPTMLTAMQIVQGQLKKAGIELKLDVVDHQTYHAQIRKDLSDVVYYAAARFPVADTYLTQFFDSASTVATPTAVTNFSHCNAADAEIRAARTEPDPEKQKALWKTAQAKIIEQVCAVPLSEGLQVWAHKKSVDYGYDFKGAIHLGPVITEMTDKK